MSKRKKPADKTNSIKEKAGTPQWDRLHTWLRLMMIGAIALTPFVYNTQLAEGGLLPRYLLLAVVAMLCVPAMLWLGYPSGALKSKGLIGVGLFFGIGLISPLWAMDQPSALLGVMKLLVMAQLFLIAFVYTRRKGLDIAIPTTMLMAGAVLGVIGILQSLGVEVPPYRQIQVPALTFHGKNAGVHVLAGLLPVGLSLLFIQSASRWRVLKYVAVALLILIMILARSRAGWLVLATMPLLFFGLLAWRGREILKSMHFISTRRMLLGTALLLIVLIPSALLILKSNQDLRDNIELKVEALFTLDEDVVKYRGAAYLNACRIILDHPVLGVGVGNFRATYPRYHDYYMSSREYTLNHYPINLHNDVLQFTLEQGLIAGLGFLAFILVLVVGAVRSLGNMEDPFRVVKLGLAVGLLAILLDGMFTFPLQRAMASLLFWVIAGMLAGSLSPALESDAKPAKKWSWHTAAIIVMLVNLGLVFGFTRWIQGAEWHYRGSVHNRDGRMDLAVQAGQKAYEMFPWDWRFPNELIHWVYKQTNGDPTSVAEILTRQLTFEPYNPRLLFFKGVVAIHAKSYEDALGAMDEAARYVTPAPQIDYLRGQLREGLGDEEGAIQMYRRTLYEDPDHEKAEKILRRLTGEKPPAAPQPEIPAKSQIKRRPTVQWRAIEGAIQYNVWFSDANGGSFGRWYSAVEAGCSNGQGICEIRYKEKKLAPGPVKFRIRASNSAGKGPWSDALTLEVVP